MDWRSTHTMLHEQAIYQHDGEQYQVERLDFENHKAFVRKVEPDYFTDAMTYTRVEVHRGGQAGRAQSDGRALRASARCRVVEKVVGYKKIKFHTHENVGYGDVRLPEMQMHTTAFWLMVPEALVESLPYARPTVIDALRGFGNALHTVAAVGLMIDPRDLGQTLGDRTDEVQRPESAAGRRASIRRCSSTTTCRGASGSRRVCSRRATSCSGARARSRSTVHVGRAVRLASVRRLGRW